jgi:hypothetical protein
MVGRENPMQLTLSATNTLESIQGTRCRKWTGTTASGVRVHVWIAAVSPQTLDEGALEAFETELIRLPDATSSEPISFDLRLLI